MNNNIRKILINLNFGNIVEGVELFDFQEGIMCKKFKYENGNVIEKNFYQICNNSDIKELETFIDKIEFEGTNTNPLDISDDETTIDMIVEKIGTHVDITATIPCGILEFYKEINTILKNASIINIEVMLLMISFYYVISTSQEWEYISLQTAINTLNYENKFSIKDDSIEESVFNKFPKDHPVTNLFNCIKNIGSYEYKSLLQKTILKLSYYNSVCKNNNLMTMSSDAEIEYLAYEIIYFNKGTDELLKEAQFDVNAMNEIGERYSYSNLHDEAYKIFEIAASKGNKKAMFNKIWCLYNGKGIERDYNLAYIELEKLSNEVSSDKIIEMLGEMYYLGNGTEKNYNKAFEKFSFIEKFNSQAKYYLGQMYLNGEGVEKDETKAKTLIMESAEMRNKKAINFLNNRDTVGKEEELDLDSLFENGIEETEFDKEYSKYYDLYEEKFGKHPMIRAQSKVTREQMLAAIKECLDKNMDILDKILYGEGRKTDKNVLY